MLAETDRIIFGDNQFFGINHRSEDQAQAQAERFRDTAAILRVVDAAYEAGIHAFMFNTHDRVAEICDHFRAHPDRYPDLRLYPSLPYAHKYANAVNEKGIVGALQEFLLAGRTLGQTWQTVVRGGRSLIRQDVLEAVKLLLDAELWMFRDLPLGAIFLQNIVADLLLGLRARPLVRAFAEHVRAAYGVDPAFNTMNLPRMAEFLGQCGIENPILCSAINKAGYFMSPSVAAYEAALQADGLRAIAMSIFASGAIPPEEAVAYVCRLPHIRAIVFGASSREHIEQTRRLILAHWPTPA